MLEAPLSADDIKLAISHFAQAKAPGSDGLPIKFYAHFSETLIPRLITLYQAIFKANALPDSMRKAIIVLIPKPGKDPHLPESYRPISLLQTDIKILAKILVLRLNTPTKQALCQPKTLHLTLDASSWTSRPLTSK